MQSAEGLFHRPTVSVSVPPHQREAFYRALLRLKQEDDAVFGSVSALIVKAVIERASSLDDARLVATDFSTHAADSSSEASAILRSTP